MSKSAFGSSRDAARLLRKHCPPDLRVRITRPMLGAKHAGWCHRRKRHYSIELCSTLTEESAVFILLHEWAHALSWDEKQTHGPEWGKAYARCWRAVFEEV